jgi:hypothetical protein
VSGNLHPAAGRLFLSEADVPFLDRAGVLKRVLEVLEVLEVL